MSYLDANSYFRSVFGKKVYKAAISLPVTCPNRDGRVGVGGCVFCSEGGSGEFATESRRKVTEQIDEAILRVSRKAGDDAGYLAYFQSFTSTYCEPSVFRKAVEEALLHPRIVGLSIATRPDCLPDEILDVIEQANLVKPVFVELGLQTSDDTTAKWINRGYETRQYDEAVRLLHFRKVNVITHVIFGLKGENEEMMLNTVRHAVEQKTDGIKFTCLYILRNTRAYDDWANNLLKPLERDEYFDIVEKALALLPEKTVVHRLTGDGQKRLLVAPLWTFNKRETINYINKRFGR